MNKKSIWRNESFDSMCWHDCSVHSFAVRERDDGNGILIFDIDYIIQWLEQGDGRYRFLVAPAELAFHEVSDLVVQIDYKKCSVGITAFMIERIKRDLLIYPSGYETYRWNIDINWPSGSIEFIAREFSMTQTSDSIETYSQTIPRPVARASDRN